MRRRCSAIVAIYAVLLQAVERLVFEAAAPAHNWVIALPRDPGGRAAGAAR